MPTKFEQLSSYDQFRVYRLLAKGETSNDPELAGILLESADQFRAQTRLKAELFRWAPMVTALVLALGALPEAFEGQVGMVLSLVFVVVCALANLMFNPWIRPKNVARSAEASRRVIAQSGPDQWAPSVSG